MFYPPPENPNLQQDIFNTLIGAKEDLQIPIKQAKAAMLYPPNGLHLLITGPTGTGKTTFANTIHKFAINSGCLKKDAPYIIFNCADYAENKQLLLSQLFGHTKGAYTGAEKEKTGLVDNANGGILFLDEIHRLPPEGQEMLFSLIDRGTYSRLGETKATHSAKVLIIGATTEEPKNTILETFLRRIPMVITLPALNKRPLKVRMQLICSFFQEEALKIGKLLIVEKEVIKMLLLYKCQGNIGQLKNDIRIICANSFIENITTCKTDSIKIKLSQIIENMDKRFFTFEEKKQELMQTFNFNNCENIIFSGTQNNLENDFKYVLLNKKSTDKFYEELLVDIKELINKGYSVDSIKHNIIIQMQKNKLNILKDNIQSENKLKIFSKIITPEIIQIVSSEINSAENLFKEPLKSKIIYSLSLHIETLLSRITIGTNRYNNYSKINIEHKKEYHLAQRIIHKIESLVNIKIPQKEIYLISTFLYSVQYIRKEEIIPILVIAHGDTVAKSMVKVTKELLSLDNIYALDMAMNDKVDDTLEKAVLLAQKIDKGKGILILVDMGSLTTFGEFITKKTGIKTKTLKMVSTPMVIEATRKGATPGITLNELSNDVCSLSSFIGNRVKLSNSIDKNLTFNLNEIDYHSEKLLKILENILIFLDVNKTYNLLNQVLINIEKTYNKPIDFIIKVKFFFHCSCLLERAIKNEPLPYKDLEKYKQKNIHTFNILKKEFSIAEETFGLKIADTELMYVLDLLNIYF